MLRTLTTFVTDLQLASLISFAAWILLGALIGFIGSKIVNKTGYGLVRDVLLSIFGAIFGGFLANLLGESQSAGLDGYSLFVAAVGAFVFLITYLGMFRRRGFLVWPNHDRRKDSIEQSQGRSDVHNALQDIEVRVGQAKEAKESEYVVGTNGVTAGLVGARLFRPSRWRVYSSLLVRGRNRIHLPLGHSTASGLRTNRFSAKARGVKAWVNGPG